jgi:hypothetical protein
MDQAGVGGQAYEKADRANKTSSAQIALSCTTGRAHMGASCHLRNAPQHAHGGALQRVACGLCCCMRGMHVQTAVAAARLTCSAARAVFRPRGRRPLAARLVHPSTSGCSTPTARLATCGDIHHHQGGAAAAAAVVGVGYRQSSWSFDRRVECTCCTTKQGT